MEFYWITKKDIVQLDILVHKELDKKLSRVGSNKNADYWEFFNGINTVQLGVPKFKDPNFQSEYSKIKQNRRIR